MSRSSKATVYDSPKENGQAMYKLAADDEEEGLYNVTQPEVTGCREIMSLSDTSTFADWLDHRLSTSSRKNRMSKNSQWDLLLEKFYQEKSACPSVPVDMPRIRRSTKTFPTGSKYLGSWNVLGMSGQGKYVYNNGVIYEGEFEDGVFHGAGQLIYPNGVRLEGIFRNGEMIDRKLIFDDGVCYSKNDWTYCKHHDRRFSCEFQGIKPAGRSAMTAKQPTRRVPPGLYDNEEGFFDPETKSIYSATKELTLIRSPCTDEQNWIMDNCRYSNIQPLGPCQHLYEEWSTPLLNPDEPPLPPLAAQVDDELNNCKDHAVSCSSSTSLWVTPELKITASVVKIRPPPLKNLDHEAK